MTETVSGESRNRAMTDWGEARRMRPDWLRHGDRYTIHIDPPTDVARWITFSEDPRRPERTNLRLGDGAVVWILVRKARAGDLTPGDRYVTTEDGGPRSWRKALDIDHDRDGLHVHVTLDPDVAVTDTTLEARSDNDETLNPRDAVWIAGPRSG